MQTSTPTNQNKPDSSANEESIKHLPVLVSEVLRYLDPKPGETYLDLTAGYGGHAAEVLKRTLNANACLVDRDQNAVNHLTEQFKDLKDLMIKHQDFLSATTDLIKSNQRYDLILADLGVSSPHLNTAARGFAINHDGPLDMRMDQSQKLDAYAVVNHYSEQDLADIIKRYGEEPRAHRIARAIVQSRPINTTTQLAATVARAWPPGKNRIHPATKVFQALRIEVNDELRQVEQALPLWIQLLKPGGRLVVISFHSLEDRLVKQALAEVGGDTYDAIMQLLTKQPITASAQELVFNPRSRSAKLRAAVKINTKGRMG